LSEFNEIRLNIPAPKLDTPTSAKPVEAASLEQNHFSATNNSESTNFEVKYDLNNEETQNLLFKALQNQIDLLDKEYNTAKNSNGWASGTWDWVKNTFNFGASSEKAQDEIEKAKKELKKVENKEIDIKEAYKNIIGHEPTDDEIDKLLSGEITLKEISSAGESLNNYQEGQKMSTDVVADIVSGIASVGVVAFGTALGVCAAPFTGGASLASIGAGVALAATTGAAVKTTIKATDCINNEKEYSAQDALYDIVTGSFNGAMGPISNGAGGAVGTGIMKLAGMEALETTAKTALKVAGGEVVEEIIEESAEAVVKNTGKTLLQKGATILAKGFDMATDGTLSGAADGFSRAAAEGRWEDIPQDTFNNAVGGFFASPIISTGFNMAGKAGTKLANTKAGEAAKELVFDNLSKVGDYFSDLTHQYTPNLANSLDNLGTTINDKLTISAINKAVVQNSDDSLSVTIGDYVINVASDEIPDEIKGDSLKIYSWLSQGLESFKAAPLAQNLADEASESATRAYTFNPETNELTPAKPKTNAKVEKVVLDYPGAGDNVGAELRGVASENSLKYDKYKKYINTTGTNGEKYVVDEKICMYDEEKNAISIFKLQGKPGHEKEVLDMQLILDENNKIAYIKEKFKFNTKKKEQSMTYNVYEYSANGERKNISYMDTYSLDGTQFLHRINYDENGMWVNRCSQYDENLKRFNLIEEFGPDGHTIVKTKTYIDDFIVENDLQRGIITKIDGTTHRIIEQSINDVKFEFDYQKGTITKTETNGAKTTELDLSLLSDGKIQFKKNPELIFTPEENGFKFSVSDDEKNRLSLLYGQEKTKILLEKIENAKFDIENLVNAEFSLGQLTPEQLSYWQNNRTEFAYYKMELGLDAQLNLSNEQFICLVEECKNNNIIIQKTKTGDLKINTVKITKENIEDFSHFLNIANGKYFEYLNKNIQETADFFNILSQRTDENSLNINGCDRKYLFDYKEQISDGQWEIILQTMRKQEQLMHDIVRFYKYQGDKKINGALTEIKNNPNAEIEKELKNIINALSNYMKNNPTKTTTHVYRGEGYSVLNSIYLQDGRKLSDALKSAITQEEIDDIIMQVNSDLISKDYIATQERFMSTAFFEYASFHKKPILWDIEVPAGTEGIFIEGLNKTGRCIDECEFLLQRNSFLRIMGIKYNNVTKRWDIKAQVLSPKNIEDIK